MKKNKGKNIIIVLLLLLIVALGGYIAYDKILSKDTTEKTIDKKEEPTQKEEKETLETTGSLVTSLVNKITNAMGCTDFKNIYLTDGVFKSSDFSNQDIYSLALSSIFDEVAGNINVNPNYKDFNEETLNTAITKIVGSEYKFTHQSYISCPAWDYDGTTKTYKAPETSACGCTSGPYHTIAVTTKAFKEEKKVEIYQRVIFVDPNTGKGYSDSNKTKEITDLTRLSPMNEEAIDEKDYSNISKGTLYKLTFEKENDDYIFIQSEPVNE